MSTLKFTATHEWIKQDNHEYTVGITDHAQSLLGDMVYVDLPDVGKTVQQGDTIGVVESVKAASDFYAPVSGTIKKVNPALQDNPALINTDPFGAGWIVCIEPSQPEELNTLLDEQSYHQTLTEH